MARGDTEADLKALAMRKWFNTNYHYIVPELCDDTRLTLTGDKPFAEYHEALALGIETKPYIIGPFTFLKLASYTGTKRAKDFAGDLVAAYRDILESAQPKKSPASSSARTHSSPILPPRISLLLSRSIARFCLPKEGFR